MTEEEIRKKTKDIFLAYEDLTGYSMMPDIGSFLQLRRQAVDELRFRPGEIMGTVTLTDSSRRKEPGAHFSERFPVTGDTGKDERHAAAGMQEAGARISLGQAVREQEQGPGAKDSRYTQETRDEGPGAHTGAPDSDYEILRRIRDPWN